MGQHQLGEMGLSETTGVQMREQGWQWGQYSEGIYYECRETWMQWPWGRLVWGVPHPAL